jgi:methylated-DNA-protein-cysteine methyltransferase-like protein
MKTAKRRRLETSVGVKQVRVNEEEEEEEVDEEDSCSIAKFDSTASPNHLANSRSIVKVEEEGSIPQDSHTATAKREHSAQLAQPVQPTQPGQEQMFAWRVLQVVLAIPRGKVASYGQCAALAGSPKKPRQVGKLLAAGLAGGFAPWQRVLNAGGKISLAPDAGGTRQRRLLEAENVTFTQTGRVGVGTFWDPTPQQVFALFH